MKRFLLLAVSSALLVAGCQKTEVINPVGGPAMSFTTAMNKITKSQGNVDAENMGQRNLEAQDFSVWAYADPESDFSTVTTVDATTRIYDGMSNLLIECTQASVDAVLDNEETETDESVDAVPGTWSTGKEYYWPGENKNLRFFAVSADGTWLRPTGEGATCPVSIDFNTPSMTISNFEVKADPVVVGEVTKKAADEDLMVADYVKQNQSNKTVNLTFRHTLAKVEFVFKTLATTDGSTAPDVWVQSLQMEGLKYKGNLSVTHDASVTDRFAWDFQWAPHAATTTFKDDWTEGATYLEGADAEVTADPTAMKLTTSPEPFSTWLMLPQTITSDNKVSITYVINKRQFTAVFPLSGDEDTTISAWGDNQHIKYTVVLAPNVISFNPTVQEWTTPAIDVEYQN